MGSGVGYRVGPASGVAVGGLIYHLLKSGLQCLHQEPVLSGQEVRVPTG